MSLKKTISKPEIFNISDHQIKKNQLDKEAISIISRLIDAGYEAYIVGGYIRDSLIGVKSKDCDVATNATPEEIKEVIPKTRIIGKRFKIVHARVGKKLIEISTFRSSGKKNIKKSNKGILLRDNNY